MRQTSDKLIGVFVLDEWISVAFIAWVSAYSVILRYLSAMEPVNVSLMSLLITTTIFVIISTGYLLYQFIHFYPTLGIYCLDSPIRNKACNNLISLSILSTISFQLSVGSVSSILLKKELMPLAPYIDAVVVLGSALYLTLWNLTLIYSVMLESKLRLAFCWSTMVIKLTFLSYLIVKVSSMVNIWNDDLFVFTLLIMGVIVIFIDAIILCRTVMAINMFGQGFSSKVASARRAIKERSAAAAAATIVEQRVEQRVRPLSALLLV